MRSQDCHLKQIMSSSSLSHHKQQRRARGFSLIEALITVAVFSIGLLGVAMTQYTALREQRNAQDFGSANESLGYLAEIIHINGNATRSPTSYNLSLAGVDNCTNDPDPTAALDVQDITRWQQMLCSAFGPGNVQSAIAPVTGQSQARWAMVVWIDRQQRGSASVSAPPDPNCPTSAQQYPGLPTLNAAKGQRCAVLMIVP